MNTIFIFSVVAILAIFIIAQVIFKKLQSKKLSETKSKSDVEQMVNAYKNGAQYKKARTRLWELMIIVSAAIALVAFAVIAIIDENKQDKQKVEKGENQEQVSQTSTCPTFFFCLVPHSDEEYKEHYLQAKSQKVQEAQDELRTMQQMVSEYGNLSSQSELNVFQKKLAEKKSYSFLDYIDKIRCMSILILVCVIVSAAILFQINIIKNNRMIKYSIIAVLAYLSLAAIYNFFYFV